MSTWNYTFDAMDWDIEILTAHRKDPPLVVQRPELLPVLDAQPPCVFFPQKCLMLPILQTWESGSKISGSKFRRQRYPVFAVESGWFCRFSGESFRPPSYRKLQRGRRWKAKIFPLETGKKRCILAFLLDPEDDLTSVQRSGPFWSFFSSSISKFRSSLIFSLCLCVSDRAIWAI